MFRTINRFKDEDGRVYEVGNVYPHADVKKKPTKKRIDELTKANKNAYNKVYIAKEGDQ